MLVVIELVHADSISELSLTHAIQIFVRTQPFLFVFPNLMMDFNPANLNNGFGLSFAAINNNLSNFANLNAGHKLSFAQTTYPSSNYPIVSSTGITSIANTGQCDSNFTVVPELLPYGYEFGSSYMNSMTGSAIGLTPPLSSSSSSCLSFASHGSIATPSPPSFSSNISSSTTSASNMPVISLFKLKSLFNKPKLSAGKRGSDGKNGQSD